MDQHFSHSNTGWNWVASVPYWQGMASPVCHSSYCYCLPNSKVWCWYPVIVLVLIPGSLIHLWYFSVTVFLDDRLNLNDIKMFKTSFLSLINMVVFLVSSLAPLARSGYYTSNYERLDSSSHSCNQGSRCLYAGNNFVYFLKIQ